MPGFRLRAFARFALPALVAVPALVAAVPAPAREDAAALYQRNCAACHGAQRQGTGLGPPLSADTYRYGGRQEDLARVIGNGIASRGMPAFGKVLSPQQIGALAAFLPARQAAPEPAAPAGQADAAPPPRTFDPVPGVVDTLDYAVRVERIAQGLETVWSIAFLDPRTALVAERPGRLRIIRDGVLQPRPVAGLPPIRVQTHRFNQGGLFDIALDPGYADNGWIYLSYADGQEERGPEGERLSMTRVVRGRLRDGVWVDNEVVYEADRDAYTEAAWHFGGRMLFDREGRLYLSTGDRREQELAREPGWPGGKIHRVMPDGSIPPDNPFAGRSDALGSVYSVGHRNPQGLALDPASGRLWSTEHGPRGGDELNLIVRGGDYGWPVASHGINYDGTVLTPHVRADGVQQPAWYWRPSIGVSGLAFYDGAAFPLWRGKLLVTALAPRELRLLTLDGDRVQHEETLLTTEGRPYEPVVGPDGAVYVVTDAPGEVLRLSVEEERRL